MCKKTQPRKLRKGVAAVELAVCLPILFVVVFGGIETCNAIYLKQTATSAAYEAAKISTGSGGTEFAARTRVTEMLASSNLTGGTVNFSPALPDTLSRGTRVVASVSIPTTNNLGGINLFYRGQSMSASVTMVKQ
jgi:hypothetical protein